MTRPHSSVRLIAEKDAFTPGTSTTIAAVFDLDKGWHTYADSVNDSGGPLLINWALPDGFEIGEAIWPAGHRHVQAGGVLDHTFDDRLVVLFPVSVDDDAEIGSDAVISASMEWLVRREPVRAPVCRGFARTPGQADERVRSRCR